MSSVIGSFGYIAPGKWLYNNFCLLCIWLIFILA
jgi:hypothetical protein